MIASTLRFASVAIILSTASLHGQGPGTILWDPANSTYDGKAFTEIAEGVGLTKFGLPGASNPAGAGGGSGGVYLFGFASAVPGEDGPTIQQMELGDSDLKAGTRLVLEFTKAEEDRISFAAMLADASQPGNVGVRVLSPTRFQVTATIVDPVLSETNDPDDLDAAFGLIVQASQGDNELFNFRGTTFITDMVWTDLEPLALSELPQLSDPADIGGFTTGLAARGVSASGGTASFSAFIPEALFAAGREHGVDVTGDNCLGYRSYVELTGSDDGFFKLNVPDDEPQAYEAFDVDGDGNADPMWSYRITNSQWSRQSLMFGKIEAESDPDSPTVVETDAWGRVKESVSSH
ncbi:MAG: hypothetical protein QF689_08790 [Candidatus Latescibacteria bacterium]|jgi:hypothetical protein|nr:hypothetical protein [Candidatus Latescibacterota bacterium]MDP7448667.1 hypothetical protein [Candidatus Latescibacterota bacterium]HJP34116.1 hypothetical protein [Candidatus Latescibacterota bacterium]